MIHTIPLVWDDTARALGVSENVRQKVLASMNAEAVRPRSPLAGVVLFGCGVLAGLLLAALRTS